MQDAKMVRMANQIADYFAAYPAERAEREVTNHLRAFWEPRMRRQLVEYVQAGGDGLHPLAVKAGRDLADPEEAPSASGTTR
ncbi:formate dehydrogenase subunit delta [Aquisalimonas lutea]|uniref:formate dehydrogenase subunit delta n=1 Tax=Aquisalimonas lutea TaxID=1327750 RepID=UPI0025B62842|nr:formate dehydrogenase subunit delta [Aquisalimonas lutea]MDN3517566.1 formate dehydrogenase subunit delta [Aquisalimonas lutea]